MRPGHSRNTGSAAVELAAFLPLIALFIIAALAIGGMLERALTHLLESDAAAERAIGRWEEGHLQRGFTRPCLEAMDQAVFRSGEREAQEVRVVGESICSP